MASWLGRALQRSMSACVKWPSWLDPVKLLWLALGITLLRRRFMRDFRPALTAAHGFGLAGAPAESTLNALVFFRGEFEPVLSGVIDRTVREGDLCVDVGANVGYFSLLFARKAGARGHVVSIEASPGNVKRLRRNVAFNDMTQRVEIVEAACADSNGQATFHVNRRNDMHCRLELPSRSEADYWLMGGRRSWRRVTVPTRTLADILGSRMGDVTFIKLDIEGAEHLVVPDILAGCVHPRLHVALEVKAPHIREALEPFERAGFHLYDLRNDYRWIINTSQRRPRECTYARMYARRYMADLLLTRQPLPADWLE